MRSITIIGVGRLGGALGLALARAGHTIDHLVHRSATNAQVVAEGLPPGTRLSRLESLEEITSDVILITTGDPEIAAVAKELASRVNGKPVVLHTSGSQWSDVLGALQSAGCPTGSLHPLISISDATAESNDFTNAYFCIEGDDTSSEAARELVGSLGGRAFSIAAGQKPLYHAAAVAACGHVVALIDVAIEMLTAAGVDGGSAQEILFPLIESTIANLATRDPAAALTGTFARADLETFERHLAAIDKQMSPKVRDIYLLLGERSLDLAADGGADTAAINKLRQAISVAKRKSE